MNYINRKKSSLCKEMLVKVACMSAVAALAVLPCASYADHNFHETIINNTGKNLYMHYMKGYKNHLHVHVHHLKGVIPAYGQRTFNYAVSRGRWSDVEAFVYEAVGIGTQRIDTKTHPIAQIVIRMNTWFGHHHEKVRTSHIGSQGTQYCVKHNDSGKHYSITFTKC